MKTRLLDTCFGSLVNVRPLCLVLVTCLLCFTGGLAAQSPEQSCGTSDNPTFIQIPDRASAGCIDGIPDLSTAATLTAEVSGIPAEATIQDIEISLEIQHTWVGDLTILIEAPDGSTVPLVSGPGANTDTGCGDSSDLGSESSDFNPTSFSSITFSPFGIVDAETMGSGAGGATIICEAMSCAFQPNSDNLDLSGTANFSGTQTASLFELFSQVDGLNGTWTIYVHDGGGGDVGTLESFGVCVTHDIIELEPEGTFCTSSTNDAPVNIPDRGAAGCVDGIEDLNNTAQLTALVNTIPEGAMVTDISVSMDIQHTWVGDLTIILEAPDGSTLPLVSGAGASTETGCGDSSDLGTETSDFNPSSFSTITFSAAGVNDAESMGMGAGGATVICDVGSCDFFPNPDGLNLGETANFSGIQINAFEQFYGLGDGLNGIWTLYIDDGGGGDVGVIEDFEICVSHQPQEPVPPSGTACFASPVEQVNIPDRMNAGCVDGIEDLATAAALTSTVSEIPDDVSITDISVTIDIQHTWVGDLTILIEAPDGSTLPLVSGPGASTETGCGDSSDFGSEAGDFNPTSFSTVAFRDGALTDAENIGSGAGGATIICPGPDPCDFYPNGDGLDLSSTLNFTGTQINTFADFFDLGAGVNGDWTLYAHDGGGGDVGVLRGFSVCISYDAPPVPEEVCGMSSNIVPLEIPNGVNASCSGGIFNLNNALAVPVEVNGIPGSAPIVDIQATLGVQHTRVGELSALLAAPDGTTVVLFSTPGGTGSCGNTANFGVETGNFMPTAFDSLVFLDSGMEDPELMGDGLADNDRVCPDKPCEYFANADGLNLSTTINFTGDQVASFADLFPLSDTLNGIWTLYLYDGDTTSTEVGTLEFVEVCVSYGEPPQPPGVAVCYPRAESATTPIPDRGSAGCVTGIADLTDAAVLSTEVDGIGATQNVSDISVNLSIQHTWVGDLTILVEAPDGTTLPLVSKAGSSTDTGCGDSSDLGTEASDFNPTSFSNITFSDLAATDAELMGAGLGGASVICNVGPCEFFPNPDGLDLSTTLNFSGTQISSFAEFFPQGDALNGTWRLFVHDGGGGDVGTINGFEVCVTTEPQGPPPTIICPIAADTFYVTESNCEIPVDDFAAVATTTNATDVTQSIPPQTLLGPGEFPLVVTATGPGGMVSCTIDLIVIDTFPPTLSCPTGPLTFMADPVTCDYTVVGTMLDPVYMDNCPGETIINDYNFLFSLDGASFMIGTTTVTFVGEDPGRNADTCSFTIIITGETIEECPEEIVPAYLDESGTVILSEELTTIFADGTTFEPDTFYCADLGEQNVIAFFAGLDGECDKSCAFMINVQDTLAPVIVCRDTTVYLDESGQVDLTLADLLVSASDNCALVDTIGPAIILDCADVDQTPRPFDDAIGVVDNSGLETRCSPVITVVDTISPTLMVNDLTVVLDNGSGTAVVDSASVVAMASDNCLPVVVTFDRPLIFTCEDIPEVMVVVTATDPSGNSITRTATITVLFEQPELACRGNINVTLNDDCRAELIPQMLLTGNVACLDVFDFEIVVQDDDPSNGPIIDGCGEFSYMITSVGTGIFDLDFETCWGTVRAEDKTSPVVVDEVAPIDLLCVDVDENRVELLPNNVSRCYRVFGATGATVPGSISTALRDALSANVGSTAAVVPTFTDGCAEELEVCVTEDFASDEEDPMCNDMILTRTFTATEVSSCVSASGEENAPAVSSYVITFTRPGLADLNGDNIPPTADFNRCGVTTGGVAAIRADYPAPRAGDYPFLAIDGRTFNLSPDSPVCNLGVTYEDGNPTVTCANTYKFVRTYTVIDWCNTSEVATFSQIVKVGDNAVPDFNGPTQDRDFDGEVDGDLIFSTNAGNACAAYLILDGSGISISDNCTANEDIVLTATIFPGGDVTANPIGAFAVDLFNGTPEVSTPIPVGTHLLRYTYSDECGNEAFEDFPFTVEDATAPVAICEDALNVSISSGGTTGGPSTGVAVLTAAMVDAGSYDDCSEEVSLSIARVNSENIATEAYSDEVILTCADLGTVSIGLRVEDGNGNVNYCWLDVLVEDKNVPTCIPPGPMNITCVEYNENFPADITEVSQEELALVFGSALGIDNCEVTVTPSVEGSLNSCGIGSIVRTFVAEDEVGFVNTNNCTQTITIRGVHDYRITFPTDEASGCADIPAFDGLDTDEFGCDLITTNVSVDTIEAVNAEVCFTLRVNYDVINFCEFNQLGEPYRIPRDGDGIRNPETQLLYLNVIPDSDENTSDDIAFLSRFTDRNFNPGAPQNDQLVDDGNDNDGSDDDNDNDSEDTQAANGVGFAYAQDNSRGSFSYIQYIDVYDNNAPTIDVDEVEECFAGTSLTCTADVTLTFTAADECLAPVVTLELDANYEPDPEDLEFTGFVADNAAALGISITLSNDGDNYTINAANVPVGNHAIRVRANDGCGNTDLDIIEFCVEGDKAPTPICIQTLTVTLMPDGAGDGMAAVWASDFIASDVEDCFGNVIEDYSIYREAGFEESDIAVGDLGIDFTCADFGEDVPVRVYAIAENGTADYCSVIVEVQAFQEGLCDGDGGNLAGTIATQNDEFVAGVEVSLTGEGDMDEMVVTNEAGAFAFVNVPMGVDYTIQPAHPVAVDLATVTVTDVVLIGNVILGSETFVSDYDYLAADVDQDRTLSVGDMVSIQRVILGLDGMYTTGESWGFVPADVDVSNPFAELFPEVYNINDLATNVLDADFVGFAYGDVNSVGRSSASLEVEDIRLEAGQTHTMSVSGAALAGFQGTLELAAGLELVNVSYEGEGGLNLNGAAAGVIAMMFRSAATVNVEVRATEAGLLSDLVSLSSSVTLAEGVNANGTSGALNLNFTGVATAELVNALEQNMPNPVADVTTIGFTLAQAGDATLTIRDVAGRTISVREVAGVAGRNQVELNVSELGGATGVLSYTLVAGDFAATKKMVVVR